MTNSTAEHICRILQKASAGPRKDLTQADKLNNSIEQRSAGKGRPLKTRYPNIQDEEHIEGSFIIIKPY